ncbi:MAG: glycosyltransferase [Acidobacteria bacterium]|nr:glycosyltransferase [Acidobacteriota bacterium]
MRIVLAKTQFLGAISGADETLVTYATLLQGQGHDVSVLLLFPCPPQDQRYLRLQAAGVSVVTIASTPVRATLEAARGVARRVMDTFPPAQKLLRKRAHEISSGLTFKYQPRCAEALRALRADLVHVVTPDPGAMALIRAAHAAGVPVLYQELGIPYHPPDFAFSYQEFTAVLPLCAEVAALSPSLARQCRERLPDLKRLSVLPIIANDLRNGHPARDGGAEVNVGFAARIEHLKGPLTLLESFALARRSDARLRLLVAGAGSLEPKLKSRAAALGVAADCEFVGLYTNAAQRKAFMERLDIFALPSLTEGTPNSIAEAMSFGVPVIASDVGGIPDTLTAQTGVLVSPGDVATLAEALVSVARDADSRRRMGRAARERYETLFSPQAVLPTLLNVYRRVADGSLHGADATEPDAHPWAQVC